jgi:anthranilate phosphoribosyltransferase
MKEYIRKILDGQDLTSEEATDAMTIIMEGNATEAQIGAFLAAEKMKGERIEELAAFARVMRSKSVRIDLNGTGAVDMCGTGGDGSGTFNISTVASFVVAGAGIPVAKHGNRSISSMCGSADVLKQLGIEITIPPELVRRTILETGIGFLFAPAFHPAMKFAAKPRGELGVKTLFNIMGPMTNPAGVAHQLVGAFSLDAAEKMAEVFSELGAERVLVVHSDDGLDEISLSGPTTVFEVTAGTGVRKYQVNPEDFNFSPANHAELLGGSPEQNAEISRAVLNGERGPRRDVVVLNAGFGIYASARASSPDEGIRMAADSIDSGKALRKLEDLIEITNYS